MKTIPEHKDRIGRLLSIDDCVASTSAYNANGLIIAQVIGFTPKMVKLSVMRPNGQTSVSNRYPSDIVIIDAQAVLFYLLAQKN